MGSVQAAGKSRTQNRTGNCSREGKRRVPNFVHTQLTRCEDTDHKRR